MDFPFEFFVGGFAFDYSTDLPIELVSLFVESDRSGPMPVDDAPEEEAQEKATAGGEAEAESAPAIYETSVSTMRQRLEIMSFTDSQWKEEVSRFAADQIDYARSKLDRYEPNTPEWNKARRNLTVLRQSSPERWMKKMLQLLDRLLNGWIAVPEDTLQHALYDRKINDVEPIFSRKLVWLRGALEVLGDEDTVAFHFSNAVYDDLLEPRFRLSEEGRKQLLRPVREFERILIPTEGRSDARLLRRSFELIRPAIAHMYSYMEHEAFKAEGSTSALVNLAKNLAAAGISNRAVFVFDNDTAGHEGLKNFAKNRLPNHFIAITLPQLGFATTYPTIGPTGHALADINKCACGVELYCGPAALTGEDGQLCPIQWTGYNAGMKRYQGEPLDKSGIQKRFLERLESSPDPIHDPEFESMRLVLRTITEIQWT